MSYRPLRPARARPTIGPATDGKIVERAHAKLNLTLEIMGRREDGYHDIASVMQTVELHDDVTVESSGKGCIDVVCDIRDLSGESNLCYRAATSLAAHAGEKRSALISIRKRIPVAAGLGGGSADAAATLRALNRLWGLGLGVTELAEIGSQAGSDVPFLVHEGAGLVRGRGESVQRLPQADLGWLLVVSPSIVLEAKTARLFSLVGPEIFTAGDLSHKLAGRINAGGDVPAELFFNAFDRIADRAFEGLQAYRAELDSLGVRGATLTGAGPSLFARLPGKEVGTAYALLMERKLPCKAFVTRAWSPG